MKNNKKKKKEREKERRVVLHQTGNVYAVYY